MSVNDSLSDLLSIIRNGQQAGLAVVKSPTSNLRKDVLNVLKAEGYIRDYSEDAVEGSKHKKLSIELKYFEGKPAIKVINRVSTPGLRKYSEIKKLKNFYNGLGISILSTSKGVMTDQKAKEENVGGEVLCSVF